ncbi:MAG: alkaline phosphatase family protein [Phycisphaerae bacterium]
MKTRTILIAALLLAATVTYAAPPAEETKLVLFVVVDGLRYDSLHRDCPRLGPDGFNRLLREGVEYRQALYGHANTFTAVGHATLLTGTYTPQHGIAGNYWYAPQTGDRIYAVGDPAHPLIGQPPDAPGGRSPVHLLASTFGDELVVASGGRSRVFGVSGKDRAAILPAGHLGQAYWYDPNAVHFVTSTYYRQGYPDWVTAWHQTKPAERYREATWSLLRPADDYANREDDRPGEKGYKQLGRTFPHALAGGNAEDFGAVLRYTPFSDDLLLAFTKELVRNEQLGQRDAVDLLAVSFSAMDYIQHGWGVRSLEAEDNLLRVDRSLADLLHFLDETVGPNRTLVVLTADHGFDDIPEEWQRLGFDAGRHDPKELLARANADLREHYRTTEDLVLSFWPPALYLDQAVLARLNLTAAEVEPVLARVMLAQPGIALAVTRGDLLTGRLPDDPIHRRVQMAFHPKRSGNVLVVQDQFWYLYTDPVVDATTHGSPYHYDVHVPLIFAGPGIRPGVVQRPVDPAEAAAALSGRLRIAAPSKAMPTTLLEVLGTPAPAAAPHP